MQMQRNVVQRATDTEEKKETLEASGNANGTDKRGGEVE
jgi:hypothetical protein